MVRGSFKVDSTIGNSVKLTAICDMYTTKAKLLVLAYICYLKIKLSYSVSFNDPSALIFSKMIV
jgi:hypothetical protein